MSDISEFLQSYNETLQQGIADADMSPELITGIDWPSISDVIVEKVALHYELLADEIRGKKRDHRTAEARNVAMFLVREWTRKSYTVIGHYFFRDHSTVVFAYKKVYERIQHDHEFSEIISVIRHKVFENCGVRC